MELFDQPQNNQCVTIIVFRALRLGHAPRSEDAHSAVRAYLQGKLDEKNDAGRTSVSQWLREEALLDLVEKKLSDKYWRWFNIWFDATYKKRR